MPGNKILIVDDDYSVSIVVKMTLEGKHEVATTASAAEAFDFLARNRVDLVLLDIKMPGMNGIDALKEIKKRHPHIVVLMLTAYPNEKNTERAWENGANGIIAKPFEVKELRDFVDSAIEGNVGF